MEIRKVAIIGMGALGVMYGDFLTGKLGKDSVGFVASRERIERYQEEGVFCNGKRCDFQMVDENAAGSPADLLIFAVKSTQLESAIHSAKNKVGKDTIILSVLNGISSEEVIGRVFGMEKIIHCVVQGMDVVTIGREVTYQNFGEFCIGIPDDTEGKKKRLRDLVSFFDRVGMPYRVDEDIMHRIWCKFMLNVGVNQAVMIYEGTYGTIQKPGKARELMLSAMKEVIELARYENINITQEDFDYYVGLMDSLDPEGMPSMRQDGLLKRKSEVEQFAGTVISLAKKHNIDVPVNRWIYDTVKKMESEY